MESDKPEPYLLGFDNAPRQTSYGAAAIEPVLDGQLAPTPFGLGAPPAHSWVIASFQTGARLEDDQRAPGEAGLWVWTCSDCGLTGRTVGSVVPPAMSACAGKSERRKISERLRPLLGGRKLPAERSLRFENLLCWMDRYQEEDFPIPPHWVSEALEIMAEGAK